MVPFWSNMYKFKMHMKEEGAGVGKNRIERYE